MKTLILVLFIIMVTYISRDSSRKKVKSLWASLKNWFKRSYSTDFDSDLEDLLVMPGAEISGLVKKQIEKDVRKALNNN